MRARGRCCWRHFRSPQWGPQQRPGVWICLSFYLCCLRLSARTGLSEPHRTSRSPPPPPVNTLVHESGVHEGQCSHFDRIWTFFLDVYKVIASKSKSIYFYKWKFLSHMSAVRWQQSFRLQTQVGFLCRPNPSGKAPTAQLFCHCLLCYTSLASA